jgi:hypothetical protein
VILGIVLVATLAALAGALAWIYMLRRRMRQLKRTLRSAVRERDRALLQAGEWERRRDAA